MANVITCQNCFTNKVNVEDFYVLSLEIKNLTSLSQCVEKMVEPEVICDYYCNTCDKKVEEIHKYRKFETLPNILFIHLQRLVFDLETFSKIKLDNPINFAE
jgi:ubiquitin carboxyl-terminal hydrolase 34